MTDAPRPAISRQPVPARGRRRLVRLDALAGDVVGNALVGEDGAISRVMFTSPDAIRRFRTGYRVELAGTGEAEAVVVRDPEVAAPERGTA